MSDFLKMDIFFVVSTVAIVLVATLALVALFYVIRILRTADKIGAEIADEASLIRADIRDARAGVRAEGFKWKHVSTFGRKLFTRHKKQN